MSLDSPFEMSFVPIESNSQLDVLTGSCEIVRAACDLESPRFSPVTPSSVRSDPGKIRLKAIRPSLVVLTVLAQILQLSAVLGQTNPPNQTVSSPKPLKPAETWSAGSVLNEIESRILEASKPDILNDMLIGIDLPINKILPIDTDLDYNFSGATYAAIQVPVEKTKETVERLDALTKLPIAECYEISSLLLHIPQQTRCRFVRQVEVESNTFSSNEARGLVQQLLDKTPISALRTIWIESAERVSKTGLPLEKLDHVRPVAFKTDDGLFLITQSLETPERFDKQTYVKGQLAFQIDGGTNPQKSAERLRGIFFDNLVTAFSTPPLNTHKDYGGQEDENEIAFKRWNEKSNVIGRENWIKADWWNSAYERSVFLIHWQCSAAECGKILVNVDHTFFLSSDNTVYSDQTGRWSADQISRYESLYEKAVAQAYSTTVRETCRQLNGLGMMSGDVCRVRGDIR